MIFAIPLMLGRVMITLVFPILTTLSISTVLLLTFVGCGILGTWTLYKREFKRFVFHGLLLVLPAIATFILKLFYPILDFYLELLAFFPLSALMISVFTGVGAIIISQAYRQDFGKVLRLVWLVLLVIILTTLLWIPLYLVPSLLFLSLPRVYTILNAGLIAMCFYWLGGKENIFFKILSAVYLLELMSFITINLIIL